MWRRNGYSMMDQARVYREPRCRSQMLDQDVIMLQVAAANMDPDEFLINLLAKYQLIEWSGDDFDCSEDDSIRQVRLHAKTSIYREGHLLADLVGLTLFLSVPLSARICWGR